MRRPIESRGGREAGRQCTVGCLRDLSAHATAAGPVEPAAVGRPDQGLQPLSQPDRAGTAPAVDRHHQVLGRGAQSFDQRPLGPRRRHRVGRAADDEHRRAPSATTRCSTMPRRARSWPCTDRWSTSPERRTQDGERTAHPDRADAPTRTRTRAGTPHAGPRPAPPRARTRSRSRARPDVRPTREKSDGMP